MQNSIRNNVRLRRLSRAGDCDLHPQQVDVFATTFATSDRTDVAQVLRCLGGIAQSAHTFFTIELYNAQDVAR